jgi:hypothetical protein
MVDGVAAGAADADDFDDRRRVGNLDSDKEDSV